MRNLLSLASLSLLSASVVACSSPEAPEAKDPPTLRVTSPTRALQRQGAGALEVRGEYASNAVTGAPIAKVTVNGIQATLLEGNQFIASIDLKEGATLIETVATDAEGAKAKDVRAVQAGELRASGSMVDESLALALSDEAMASISRAASEMMSNTDMAAMLAPMNPMVQAGLGTQGEEDCLFGKLNVKDVNMSKAAISLKPVNGGLAFSMVLDNLAIPMSARYAVACSIQNNDLSVAATKVTVTGTMQVSTNGAVLDVKMADKTIELEGFTIQANGLPGEILNILPLDKAAETVIEMGGEAFMGPAINKALAGIAGTKTLDVMGKQLEVEVLPADVYFDDQAAHVLLSSRLALKGLPTAPQFVYTPNRTLGLAPANGFEFALADDAANQMLADVTAAGLINIEKHAPAGEFDNAVITATMPPMISADPADGRMKLIAGDLTMTFRRGTTEVAKAALNLKIALKVVGTGGGVAVDLGEPEIFVTMLDDVENQTHFLSQDIETLVQTTVAHEVEVFKQLLKNVPVPPIAGLQMSDLSVGGEHGYVVIKGALQ